MLEGCSSQTGFIMDIGGRNAQDIPKPPVPRLLGGQVTISMQYAGPSDVFVMLPGHAGLFPIETIDVRRLPST
jgi:hypothetical protein